MYAASEFGSGGFITQIAFRPDALSGGAFSSTINNIRIDLSTTMAAVDGLSGTFANNVGADDQIVFNGALALSSSFTGPAIGPKAFDIVINLATPFLYTPGANRLLDIRNFSGGSVTAFDAESSVSDATSRVYTNSANGVGDATGNADSYALVTQFTITPAAVPEPGTSVFVGVCALALLIRFRRASNSRREI